MVRNGQGICGKQIFGARHNMKMLTHLSLFSGIGGLDLAAEMAGIRTIGQCEWADFQTKVLEKHWPDVPRWRDIRTLTGESFYEKTGFNTANIISGGFPCQPHSKAGKRKASSDERDLWPEMRRVISEIRPRWVVAENVRGLLSSENGRFFGRILWDFSNLGYDVGWCCLRASEFGAIHNRERIGIVAYSCESSHLGDGFKANGMERKKQAFKDAYPSIELWQQQCNVFEPKLLRDVDGIPNWVDRIGALGNAVVPQQFYVFFKLIADIENGKVE